MLRWVKHACAVSRGKVTLSRFNAVIMIAFKNFEFYYAEYEYVRRIVLVEVVIPAASELTAN